MESRVVAPLEMQDSTYDFQKLESQPVFRLGKKLANKYLILSIFGYASTVLYCKTLLYGASHWTRTVLIKNFHLVKESN